MSEQSLWKVNTCESKFGENILVQFVDVNDKQQQWKTQYQQQRSFQHPQLSCSQMRIRFTTDNDHENSYPYIFNLKQHTQTTTHSFLRQQKQQILKFETLQMEQEHIYELSTWDMFQSQQQYSSYSCYQNNCFQWKEPNRNRLVDLELMSSVMENQMFVPCCEREELDIRQCIKTKSRQQWNNCFRRFIFENIINSYKTQGKVLSKNIRKNVLLNLDSKSFQFRKHLASTHHHKKNYIYTNNFSPSKQINFKLTNKKCQQILSRIREKTFSKTQKQSLSNIIFQIQFIKSLKKNPHQHQTKIKQQKEIKQLIKYQEYYDTIHILAQIFYRCKQYRQKYFLATSNGQINNNQYVKPQAQDKIDDLLNCEKLFDSMMLYNYVISCSQFANLGKDKKFNIDYYLKIYEQKEGENQNYSQRQKKISLFWKTYEQPQILKRIYYDSLMISQHKNIPSSLTLKIQQQKFTLFSIYRKYAPNHHLISIQKKTAYIKHYTQYIHDIIAELTSSQSLSLKNTYNCSRFILLNLLCHYFYQSVLRIQKQIYQRFGHLYYQLYVEAKNNNNIIKQCLQKLTMSIQITRQKIRKYAYQLNDQSVKEKSSNTKKFKALFFIDSKKSQLGKLYKKLNQSTHTGDISQYISQQNYDFQLTKQIYSNLIALTVKQLINYQTIQRGFRTIIKKYQKNSKTEKLSTIKLQQFLSMKAKFSQNDFFPEFNSRTKYKILDQLIFLVMQQTKIFTMIFALPYYSYWNQSNQYVNAKKQQEKSWNIKARDSTGNQKISDRNMFENLDYLYVFQRRRFNHQYFKLVINEQCTNEKSKLLQVYQQYMGRCWQIFKFIFCQSKEQREKTLSINISNQQQHIDIWKEIHSQSMCIFDKLERTSYLYNLTPSINKTQQIQTKSLLDVKFQSNLIQFLKLQEKFNQFMLKNKMINRNISIFSQKLK